MATRTLPEIDADGNFLSPKVMARLQEKLGSSIDAGAQVLQGLPLITYGSSAVAEEPGTVTDVSLYYPRQVADRFGLVYPTLETANDLKRGVGGSTAEAAAWQVIGGPKPWAPGTKGMVLVQSLGNTARAVGAGSVKGLKTARESLRTICAVASSSHLIQETDATFQFVGTGWAANPVDLPSGGSAMLTSTTGDYVQFIAPRRRAFLITAGATSAGGPAATMTYTDGGAQIAAINLGDYHATTPVAWEIPAAARGKSIRVTRTATAGFNLRVDALAVQAIQPGPVVLIKEPYKEDYSASTAFPNGSDQAYDEFNAVVDEVAALFPNAIVVDPNAGYFDPTTGIWSGDRVHYNDAGNTQVADAVEDAVRGFLAGHQRKVEAWAASTGDGETPQLVAVASDTFTRADSATLGATETGGFTWSQSATNWNIASNKIAATSHTANHWATVATGATGPQIVRAAFGPTSQGCGIIAHVNTAGNAGYMLQRTSANVYNLAGWSAGGALGTLATISGTPAAGDIGELEFLDDGTIIARINGVQKASVVNTVSARTGRHGVYAWSTRTPTFDDFKVITPA